MENALDTDMVERRIDNEIDVIVAEVLENIDGDPHVYDSDFRDELKKAIHRSPIMRDDEKRLLVAAYYTTETDRNLGAESSKRFVSRCLETDTRARFGE